MLSEQTRVGAAQAVAHKIASVMLALETGPARTFNLIPLAVRRPHELYPAPVVILKMGDDRVALEGPEAQLLVDSLRAENGYAGARLLADLVAASMCEAARVATGCVTHGGLGRSLRMAG